LCPIEHSVFLFLDPYNLPGTSGGGWNVETARASGRLERMNGQCDYVGVMMLCLSPRWIFQISAQLHANGIVLKD